MLFFGKRCELFVDNYLIEESENIRFKANDPKCVKKVISFDKPWEAEGSTGISVFRDDKNIKMYYRGFPSVGNDQSEMQTSCFAESDDGVNFERAKVNMIDYNGEKENNIVFMGTNAHNFAPFYDTNPNCKPEERYKAIGGLLSTGGLHAYASPDGIHWTEMADGAVITDGDFDSMNIAFYDANDKLYRCYSRREERSDVVVDPTVLSDVRSDVTVPRAVLRAIQVCVSTDFIHWSQPMLLEFDRIRYDHLYTNAATCIPSAEHIKISIPMRFHPKRIKLESYEGVPGKAKHNGVSDAVLMTSRDGLHWNRTVKDAWLRAGLNEREWTQRNFIALAGIIEQGEEMLMYFQKHYMWDDCGIWAYSVLRHRFISINADSDGGRAVLKPMLFESDDIYLNYSTSAYGYVKLTVIDDNGEIRFESDEIYGNELAHCIHIDGLTGRSGRIILELKEADVYAIGAKG